MRKNKKYSEELKKAAVKSYLAGEGGVDKLKEFVGHTPIQVFAGIIVGIANACLMYYLLF